jgi:hypothetical protein
MSEEMVVTLARLEERLKVVQDQMGRLIEHNESQVRNCAKHQQETAELFQRMSAVEHAGAVPAPAAASNGNGNGGLRDMVRDYWKILLAAVALGAISGTGGDNVFKLIASLFK